MPSLVRGGCDTLVPALDLQHRFRWQRDLEGESQLRRLEYGGELDAYDGAQRSVRHSGAFSNLPDQSTFTSGGNTFKANYEGGDGNDLTLTVVQ